MPRPFDAPDPPGLDRAALADACAAGSAAAVASTPEVLMLSRRRMREHYARLIEAAVRGYLTAARRDAVPAPSLN